MKNFLFLLLSCLMLVLVVPAQAQPEPDFAKATARTSFVKNIAGQPDSSWVQLSFTNAKNQPLSVENHTLYVFQTSPQVNRFVWKPTDGNTYFSGMVQRPARETWLVYVLFNDHSPTGNIRTGSLRIR
jgi:hypothetical protein